MPPWKPFETDDSSHCTHLAVVKTRYSNLRKLITPSTAAAAAAVAAAAAIGGAATAAAAVGAGAAAGAAAAAAAAAALQLLPLLSPEEGGYLHQMDLPQAYEKTQEQGC
jgi:NADPH-dependent 2,4-dienoyl-CoA reductase/sulfur reductase-like enzyme